jgi:hypothetical protein
MKSILIKFVIETIYSFYVLFQFISFVTYFNVSLAYNNDYVYNINKFKSNNNYLSVSNSKNKEK